MIDLQRIQSEQELWSTENFGEQKPSQMIMGIIEELGELSHAQLKGEQGIRILEYDIKSLKIDAIGDLVIFLCGYCNSVGLDLETCITLTWDKVKQRDWKYNPLGDEQL